MRGVMPKKIYEHIIEDIVSLINTGEISEGDRLPPERTLAKTFNVSRNTVREAIKTLSEKKILESRTGSGTYVSESGRGIIEDALQKALDEKNTD
jgi:GntR family transcriptional repressor for pyruvate dehydrogenase complex